MLSDKEKRFFIGITREASELSSCNNKQGATLIKGHSFLSFGYNRKIIKTKNWEISAVYDAIFKARDMDLSETILITTYFPSIDDLKLIIAVGVKTLYFFGEIKNSEAIDFINDLVGENIPFEIIHLE